MAKLKKTSVMLTEEMHAHIQKNAEQRGLTMNAVIIFALENYFHQHRAVDTFEEMVAYAKKEELRKNETLSLTSEQKPE